MAKFTEHQLELLTDYVGNRLSGDELNQVENLINSNPDFKMRYILEKNTAELFSTRLKNIETPLYVYQNINKGIDELISSRASVQNTLPDTQYRIPKISIQSKVNVAPSSRRYYYAAGALAVAVLVFFVYSYYFSNVIPKDKDFIEVSRNIFDKVDAGEIKLQYATNNPAELANFFKDKVDFNVFIPDIKDAELLGGVYNEIAGEKLVHFVHRCGNKLIYTMQGCMKDVMKEDKLMLREHHKDDIVKGENWKPCAPIEGDNIVVWYRDGVVCSSVSKIAPQQIASVLTSYKK
ncbi:MAG: hypothetical protein JSS63_04365 [Bacteroidetes bacterium]|nr:hypothetical protein [Bacteroidota bacterium]MBX7045673.1 hypothetical protein [Ignavibacteria bacterium]